MSARPSMLILSFSPISGDARVLKQVTRFTRDFDVTTCGYGPAPEGIAEHIRVPDGARADDLNGRLITLRLYDRAYWSLSAVKWARAALKGHAFDVAIADDAEAVPVALGLRPHHGVLADLHEYSPRLHDDQELWRKRIRPWYEWLIRRHVAKATSWSTVSRGIVAEYEKVFGFRPELVTNAAPYREVAPTPVGDTMRLVHSGACLRNRNLHLMAEAVERSGNTVSLDFYLTPNDPGYLAELSAFASSSAKVTVQEPVPYSQLADTLNVYDVGLHVLPPINFNNLLALPNKLFDYVQARLGVMIGPSPEMREYVERYGLGVVADDFTVEAVTASVDALTVERVREFKSASDAHAEELGAERQVDIWERMVQRQLGAAT